MALTAVIFINSSICFSQGNQKTESSQSSQGRIITSDTTKAKVSDKANKYYNEGYNYFEKKDFKKSIASYKLAIREDADFIDAYDNLGLAFRQLNMLDSAEYYYLASLSRNPNGFNANQNLAVVAELRKNYEKAIVYYNKLMEIETENPEGYYGLARMQFTLGRLNEAFKNGKLAEKYYKQIKSPYIGDCYYILCIISYTNKDIPLAKKYLALCRQEGVEVDKILEKALQ